MSDTPVYDERAEQSVLGALLHNPKTFGDLGGLKAIHFYKPAHELLFNTIQDMYLDGEAIDAVTVFAKLAKNEELRKVGGAPYLSDLLQSFKFAENVGTYAQIVKDQWKLREINKLGTRFSSIRADADDVPLAIEEARQFLDEVDFAAELTTSSFSELYISWTDFLATEHTSIETPWSKISERLSGGWQRQRLYVIGARPGCGKTIFGAQAALYAAQSGLKATIFSLELSKEDLMGRLIACGARVPYGEITRKNVSSNNQEKINEWIGYSASIPLTVDATPGLTIEEIAQRCRIQKQRDGLDFVFIDYLQLVPASRGDGRVEQVDHIATAARAIARKLDCVVLVAAQLNRKIEETGGKPRLPTKSDFRESGGIEQTADAALILSRVVDEKGQESKIPQMNVVTVKNRTGTEGVDVLRESFYMARFEDLAFATAKPAGLRVPA